VRGAESRHYIKPGLMAFTGYQATSDMHIRPEAPSDASVIATMVEKAFACHPHSRDAHLRAVRSQHVGILVRGGVQGVIAAVLQVQSQRSLSALRALALQRGGVDRLAVEGGVGDFANTTPRRFIGASHCRPSRPPVSKPVIASSAWPGASCPSSSLKLNVAETICDPARPGRSSFTSVRPNCAGSRLTAWAKAGPRLHQMSLVSPMKPVPWNVNDRSSYSYVSKLPGSGNA
jgi:hypothetical protein